MDAQGIGAWAASDAPARAEAEADDPPGNTAKQGKRSSNQIASGAR